MTTIWFETHATSLDNEAGLASGHADVDLSPAGVEQALALGRRYGSIAVDLVVTSDLRRAWHTAELAFGDRVPILRDPRLRECDYGDLTRAPASEIDRRRLEAVSSPFPNGESYMEATGRVRRCLSDLVQGRPGAMVLIGHRATFYALEHLLKGTPLEAIVVAPWKWQPGWRYALGALPAA
jgi:broad specificity phosphatase PhoE